MNTSSDIAHRPANGNTDRVKRQVVAAAGKKCHGHRWKRVGRVTMCDLCGERFSAKRYGPDPFDR